MCIACLRDVYDPALVLTDEQMCAILIALAGTREDITDTLVRQLGGRHA